jgi:hypothetical protein
MYLLCRDAPQCVEGPDVAAVASREPPSAVLGRGQRTLSIQVIQGVLTLVSWG